MPRTTLKEASRIVDELTYTQDLIAHSGVTNLSRKAAMGEIVRIGNLVQSLLSAIRYSEGAHIEYIYNAFDDDVIESYSIINYYNSVEGYPVLAVVESNHAEVQHQEDEVQHQENLINEVPNHGCFQFMQDTWRAFSNILLGHNRVHMDEGPSFFDHHHH